MKAKFDWPQTILMAEEIGREITKGVKIEVPDFKSPSSIQTEEIRPSKAHIINHHLNNANEWYQIDLPKGAVTWAITVRGNHEIRYSYSPAHQNYRTLREGESLEADTAPDATLNSIWVLSEEGNVIVEIEVWEK